MRAVKNYRLDKIEKLELKVDSLLKWSVEDNKRLGALEKWRKKEENKK